MSLLDKFYVRFFISSGFPYAAYLKKKGVFHSQGDNCFISKAANMPDPHLIRMGDNVWITSGCQLLCHDASVIMINIMRKGHRDRVSPIVFGSNCFLGNNVIVLPGTTIGSNTIVGARLGGDQKTSRTTLSGPETRPASSALRMTMFSKSKMKLEPTPGRIY